MSKNAIKWADRTPAKCFDKRVLQHLADWSDQYGRCNFSLLGLAESCSMPPQLVKKSLDKLAEHQLITCHCSAFPIHESEPWLHARLLINRPQGGAGCRE
jgi:hypothetical protein